MTSRSENLKAALLAARSIASPRVPDALVQAITADRPGSDAEGASVWNAFRHDFEFVHVEEVTGNRPDVAQMERWANLLAWLFSELAGWSSREEPSRERLCNLLLLLGLNDRECVLCQTMPPIIGDDVALISAIENSIQRCHTDLYDDNIPSAREVVTDFLQADAASDWERVGDLLPHVDIGHADAAFRMAVLLLRQFSLEALNRAVRKAEDFHTATALARIAGPEGALRLAEASGNRRVLFAAIFEYVGMQSSPPTADFETVLADLLVGASTDDGLWPAWMKVFNAYPSRFPNLQRPLGAALARGSAKAREAYAGSLVLGIYSFGQRPHVTRCLESFCVAGADEVRRSLWRLLHDKWVEWNFGKAESDKVLVEVTPSVLDFAVVGYALECLSSAELDDRVQSLEHTCSQLDRTWHRSAVACKSEWNRLQSAMRPYQHAQHAARSSGGWLAPPEDTSRADHPRAEYDRIRWRFG